ncbi:MAG: PEP-CTERM sorting domain-containing protein [Verrucomicrobia bacterium]|nr:PEP-CTERM sorting domain-containing protein [Verrucomicrobiota bacterium]
MKTKNSLFFIPLLATGSLFAQTALDNAGNYTSWTDGSNQGTGFQNWSFNQNSDGSTLFAGHFLGDSTDGAGDINTGSQSFGMFANPSGAFSTAIRSFASPLSINDQFTFQMGVNFDNGNKGFNLRTGGDSIFNFNVGGGGASVSSANATLVPETSVAYDYGGNDAVIDVVMVVKSASEIDYQISRASAQGVQGTLFSGSVTGITASIDNFEFYISDTDAGGAPANNLYFNNLAVSTVPEPSGFALFLGSSAMFWIARRRP